MSQMKQSPDAISEQPMSAPPRVKVLHLITYFPIFHGAQENTCLTVNYHEKSRYDAWLGTQPGGTLLSSVQGDVHLALIPHLQRAIHPVKDARAFWEIYWLCRRERFTIVHTHISKAGVLGRLAAWLAGTPIIVHTVHTISFQASESRWVNRFYLWLEKLCAPITSKFLVVSQLNTDKHLQARIGTPGQYQVVYSGVDVERMQALRYGPETVRANFGVPAGHRLVVWIGRLAYQKDPQNFVRAAAAVCREIPDVTCLMVGDGPLRAEVEALIEDLGMRGRIIITGFRDDAPEVLAAASLLAHSSRFEGMGRVISEAMLLGVPVAGTAVDGVVEAVESGRRGGLLSPPEEPEQLAAAMRRLLEDPALVEQLTTEGRTWAWARFDAREMVRQIESVYAHELRQRGIPLPTARPLAASSPAEPVATPSHE
jgi:glycosyltransferase involved in cell wall biosynthesis